MNKFDNDHLYNELSDVINHEIDPFTRKGWRNWYMKSFYILGKDVVLKIASIARADGTDKKKYFSHLLRNELKRKRT